MMGSHYSDDLIEQYSMGKLLEPELVRFEEHLLLCDECRQAVGKSDVFLERIRGAASHLRNETARI